MYNANDKNELIIAIKNREKHIVISNNKMISSLKPLDGLILDIKDINRCKYTLEKDYDGSAFLGFLGFAPMISEFGNISFFQAMGIISSVGLHEILVIFIEYRISFKNNKIVLAKI